MTSKELAVSEIITSAGREYDSGTIAAVVWKTLGDKSSRDWLNATEEEFNNRDNLTNEQLVRIFDDTIPCYTNWAVPIDTEFEKFASRP